MRALDLYCGGGGAARGLIKAGWEVDGVDVVDHSAAYPGRLMVGDALDPPVDPLDYDLVWASPPCQMYTPLRRGEHPDLVRPALEMLAGLGHPAWVVENVPASPLRADVILTGPMTGLPRILRRRHFQLGGRLLPPPQWKPILRPLGRAADGSLVTVTRQCGIYCRRTREERRKRGLNPYRWHKREAGEAMGIEDWERMTMAQIGEAVPPAYALRIGLWALGRITAEAAT